MVQRLEPGVLSSGAWFRITASRGTKRALNAAMRCADYLAENFLRRGTGGPDLLDTINQGIQHSCMLYHIAALYEVAPKPQYLDLCNYIVQRWESSTLRLVSRPAVMRISCLKAIEMLICYQGLVELGRISHKPEYAEAAARYWQDVLRSQIGPAGKWQSRRVVELPRQSAAIDSQRSAAERELRGRGMDETLRRVIRRARRERILRRLRAHAVQPFTGGASGRWARFLPITKA